MSLTIVTGPMFAGKSTWIMKQVRRHLAVGIQGLVIKPQTESRYENETDANVVTHDQLAIESISWPMHEKLENVLDSKHSNEIQKAAQVIVDEAQFMTGLYNFTKQLIALQKNVVLVGLNGDYLQRPFYDVSSKRPEFLECISLANHIEMLYSLCDECPPGASGQPAQFTKRIDTSNNEVVQVGTKNMYKSVCRNHL